jgi:hypothetical protein
MINDWKEYVGEDVIEFLCEAMETSNVPHQEIFEVFMVRAMEYVDKHSIPFVRWCEEAGLADVIRNNDGKLGVKAAIRYCLNNIDHFKTLYLHKWMVN